MPNGQLDQLMNALESKVVQLLLVAIIVVGLLSVFLKWLHHALFRKFDRKGRSGKARAEVIG